MKKSLLFLVIILAGLSVTGQTPQGINYQTVVRNGDGEALPHTDIWLKVSILADAPDGTVVYSEVHPAATNGFGLVNLVIGQGTVLIGNFGAVEWGKSSHFLEMAIDLTGGGEFQVMGVSQFLSVPYALYSGQTGDTTNWQKNQNVVYYNKGQVGIGTNQPDSSAKLDVNSNSQGFLPPRMTTEERDSIPNPAAGLIIFNTNTHCINFFNGVEWVEYGRDPLDTFECGQIFTDPRDKQQYQTVQIGDQCWFAKNLNVGTKINATQNQTDNGIVEKYCYENVPANCGKFGGLYQWDEMRAYDTLENTKGICPEGWHLPNQAEWQTLFDAFGGAEAAGTELASTGTSGFDALMNGKFDAVAGFSGQNNLSTFWSSSGTPGAQATGYDFTSGSPVVNTGNSSVFNGYGVRCLKGLPNVTDPNLKVIDTTVYRLVSDSLEMEQGTYRYQIIGSRKAKDLIVAENIVVGIEIDGYLRKVDEASINGNEMTLTTSDATFEDAFIEGEFSFNAGLTGKGKPALTLTRILYLAPGVEISPQKDGFTYNFSNLVLYEGDNVSVTIPQGHFTLDPQFNFDFKFKNKQVKRLSFYADNAILENSLDVQLNATGSVSKEYEKTLAKIEKYIGFMAGPVPVIVVITTKLKGKLNCSFDAAFMATTGYTNTNTVSFGVKYEYGNWQRIWNLIPETQLHPINWNGTISLGQNLTIVPEIDIKFYGVAGPYFNLPVWEQLDANLAVPEMNYDATLDVGLDGNIGAEVTIFGKTLASYNKELFGFKKNLYNSPAKLEIVSGNNQTGYVNSPLPAPLKVKVTDSKGLTYLPSRVHFTIETGGGTLSETDLWTDATGFAQTSWTLGALAGEQSVKAEVFKADGTAINSSPQVFTVTTQGTPGQCGQPFTDARDGQTYNTVQIGNQCWMKENLNIGTRIDGSVDMSDNNTIEKYCYENNPSNCNIYGGLYQWNEMMQYKSNAGEQGICPVGWHLPTTSKDWSNLQSFLEGQTTYRCNGISNYIAKALAADSYWNQNNTPCAPGNNFSTNNATGFSGFPGGYGFQNNFQNSTNYGVWWSSSQIPSSGGLTFIIFNDSPTVGQGDWHRSYGLSVRCLKDETTSSQLNVTPPSQDVLNDAGTTTFEVTSNTSWAVEENISWLSVSPLSGSGNGTITVTYDANLDTEPRIGQITFTAEGGNPVVTVSVNQAGAPQSCGQIVDARDGQTYNTVQIGTQCWMRENLNYETGNSWCYENNPANCDIYGRLYDWNTALSACPTGWHLPNLAEWSDLTDFVSSQPMYLCNGNTDWVGKALASTSGWNYYEYNACSIGYNQNLNNATGFTGHAGGLREVNSTFIYKGGECFFWSTTEYETTEAFSLQLDYGSPGAYHYNHNKDCGVSVRCLKDN